MPATAHRTDDLRILETKELSPPSHVLRGIPVSDQAANTVYNARRAIHKILARQDDRLVVVVGPCSIHDAQAAKEYAQQLLQERQRHHDTLEVVMRVYFEKPRTTVGWKGLINDPNLDGSFRINEGLRVARQLLADINDLGLPAGTEYLDTISPQYVADLIAWGAIGARTTESQVHRELASGLSCAIGFKNGTDGNLKIAVDAILAAKHPHHFLGVTKEGHSAILSTTGNEDGHIILRGGKTTNYDAHSIAQTSAQLVKAGLPANIMVDCSHGNSNKNHENQKPVAQDLAAQIAAGNRDLVGVMIESHLLAGRQEIVPGASLVYGQSVTDACIGWDDTVQILNVLSDAVRARRG